MVGDHLAGPAARLGLRARRLENRWASRSRVLSRSARRSRRLPACRPARLEWFIERALFLCAALSVFTTVGIIAVLAVETIAFLREVPVSSFSSAPSGRRSSPTPQFGVLPLVAGTVLVSAIAMVVALPMGLLSAIYLSEYAPARCAGSSSRCSKCWPASPRWSTATSP
jgi:ABC-type phosphate transport system permease subunit